MFVQKPLHRALRFGRTSWGKLLAASFFFTAIQTRFPTWCAISVGAIIFATLIAIAFAIAYRDVQNEQRRGRRFLIAAVIFTVCSALLQILEQSVIGVQPGALVTMAAIPSLHLPRAVEALVAALQWVGAFYVAMKLLAWTVAVCEPVAATK